MKKIIFIVLMAVLITGCGTSSATKDTANDVATTSKATQNAWLAVDAAFVKLNKTDFHYDGYTTETAHIGYGQGETFNEETMSYDKDKEKLSGVYAQQHFTADVSADKSQATIQTSIFDMESFSTDGLGGLFWDKTPYSLEEALKDHTASTDLWVYTLQNDTVHSVGTCTTNEWEPYVCEDDMSAKEWKASKNGERYLNFLNTFKYQSDRYPTLLIRGKSNIRLIPDNYFEGSVKETENGQTITFTFTPKSEMYKEFTDSSTFKDMHNGLNVVDQVVDCKKDDEGAEKNTWTYPDGSKKTKYTKIAFQDELKEAKIVVEIDKEGYPTSYKRYTYMNYDFAKMVVPYAVDFTFHHK